MMNSTVRGENKRQVRRRPGSCSRHQDKVPAPVLVGFAPAKVPVDHVCYRIRPEVLRRLRKTLTPQPPQVRMAAPTVQREPAPTPARPTNAHADLQPNVSTSARQPTTPKSATRSSAPRNPARRVVAALGMVFTACAAAYFTVPIVGSYVASTAGPPLVQPSVRPTVHATRDPTIAVPRSPDGTDTPTLTTLTVPVSAPAEMTAAMRDAHPVNAQLLPPASSASIVAAAPEPSAPSERATCPPANDALGLCK